MIVNCEKCGSTLKFNDAKIPEAGGMARCSMCSHRFLLKKESDTAVTHSGKPIDSDNNVDSAHQLIEQKKSSERIMLVTCEKCGGTLKVDATRIPERGAVARCSICAHRFLLKKEPEVVNPPGESIDEHVEEAPFTRPEPEQVSGHFDASLFAEPSARNEFAMSAATPGFETVDETSGQQEIYEFLEEVHDTDREDDVTTRTEADTGTGSTYTPFAKSLGPQSISEVVGENGGGAAQNRSGADVQVPADVAGKLANGTAEENFPADTERIPANPAAEAYADTSARFPVQEIAAADRRGNWQSGLQQQAGREVITLLDERGLSDEYVVRMVQEVCHATKYVEGVEKPDWPTRIAGLDILCKIKGLYPPEKKNDNTNRQVQIVTGINI